ncbi:outer membrane lipoprotein-sorting protein [Kordiimonas sp.]|uniref:outer membrane lipoprotein-sorting protein n=1 Tax=Kordiimonas sp. TaxID=1970157 RepID=UPI003A9201A1
MMHKPMLRSKRFAAILAVITLGYSIINPGLWADEAEERGYEIAARSDRSDTGFGDSEVTAVMTLTNAAGATSTREMYFKTLERENEQVGDKSLTVFVTPRDVQGTALLSHAKILEADDQWLFLPALKRVKRISSASKSGPFVGSEFAFEDFTSTELNKYSYKYVGEETLDGMKVDVIERLPLYENSGYTRQVAYIDQDVFQTRKLDFYDRKNALLKTLSFADYRQYGTIWRAHTLRMENHQTGKSTTLSYGDYTIGAGLSDNDFDKAVLKRIR